MKFYKLNPLAENIGESLARQLVVIKDDLYVEKGKSIAVAPVVGYDLYEIKTVTAKSDTQKNIVISIFDGEGEARQEVYQSLTQPAVQDIVAIPMRDASGQKKLYFLVSNMGDTDCTVRIEIKLISL